MRLSRLDVIKTFVNDDLELKSVHNCYFSGLLLAQLEMSEP